MSHRMTESTEDVCPLCAGPLTPLGQLGTVSHFRCRDCGADCSEAEPARSPTPRPTTVRAELPTPHTQESDTRRMAWMMSLMLRDVTTPEEREALAHGDTCGLPPAVFDVLDTAFWATMGYEAENDDDHTLYWWAWDLAKAAGFDMEACR